MYDVDAADIGEREVLTYQLLQSPAGMGIDMVTGRIEWQPDALGSYSVHVQVTDSQGNTHDQSFVLEVVPDTSAPTLDVQFSAQVVAPGQPTTLTALASDEVGVTSMVVTIDGAVVTLDASGQLQWSSDVPGAHVLVVTAVDSSGNQTQQSWTFGVSDAADNTAPSVSITAPTEDTELTYIHDITGCATDPNLLDYTLEVRRVGDTTYRTIGGGNLSTTGTLGKLDTTQLENGYYQLQLRARDVNEQESATSVLFRVDGQAKPGIVQLSFVDAVVPMAGIPVSVVRSYDSMMQPDGSGRSLTSR